MNVYELIVYLRNTLIPDLRESGSDATADDFEQCANEIAARSVDRDQKDRDREYHFFTSSAAHWTANASLRECQRIQEQRDYSCTRFMPQGYSIYKVYLPADAPYKINNFRPVLDDELVEYIDTVKYEVVEATPGQKRRGQKNRLRVATGEKAHNRDADF